MLHNLVKTRSIPWDMEGDGDVLYLWHMDYRGYYGERFYRLYDDNMEGALIYKPVRFRDDGEGELLRDDVGRPIVDGADYSTNVLWIWAGTPPETDASGTLIFISAIADVKAAL